MHKRLLLLSMGFVLAGCSAPMTQQKDHSMPMPPVSNADFSIEDRSTPDAISFLIKKGGKPFDAYGINHTKDMHLVIARNDLRYFGHLHPTRDALNVWSLAVHPAVPGTYWLYADFVEQNGTPHVLRFSHTYPGDPGSVGLVKDPKRFDGSLKEVSAGTNVVSMTYNNAGDGAVFFYDALTAKGKPAVFQDYLGEKGHVVAISEDGEYTHIHPNKEYVGYSEQDPPQFFAPELSHKFFRIFGEFQFDGEVFTTAFDWEKCIGANPCTK